MVNFCVNEFLYKSLPEIKIVENMYSPLIVTDTNSGGRTKI